MSHSPFGRWKRRQLERQTGLSRRELLQAAMTSAAGLLLAQCRSGSDAASIVKQPRRVIVVGGGFAGLAAAYELIAAGCEVVVVEAQRRMGGRVLSITKFDPGAVVEGGGEFIGSNHPAWLAYAKQFNLELVPTDDGTDAETPVLIGDRKLARAEAEALFQEMDRTLAQLNQEAAAIDADEPWKSANADALDRRSTLEWLDASGASADCRTMIRAQLENDNGVALEKQSWLANLAMVKGGGLEKYWTETEAFRCKGGANQLARCLALEIGRRRMLIGNAVQRIEHGEGGVRVQLANQATLAVDDVVLAVAPSVWSKIEFVPALPAVLAPQMGVNVKFLSSFDGRFWRDAGLAPDARSDGPIGETWEATQGQETKTPVLTSFSGGPAAEKTRRWGSEQKQDKYLTELERFYPDVRKHFGGSRVLDWAGDPWALASYSFPAPGQVTTVAPLLRSGLASLHFAGEHCSSAFVGYMEGALQSGIAVARSIAALGWVPASAHAG
jgi:monoamine oxidase